MAGKSGSNIQDKVLFVIMIFIIIGLIVSGYFLIEKKIKPELAATSEANGSNPLLASNSENTNKNSVEERNQLEEYIPETEADVIVLYFGSKGEDKLIAEARRVRRSNSLTGRATQIVNGILAGPKENESVKILPEKLALRGLFFDAGTFTLDMSNEFAAVEQMGAGEEMLAVYSIVNSLTELDPKARIKFLVNGTEPEYDFGHLDMTIPLKRIDNLIKSNNI